MNRLIKEHAELNAMKGSHDLISIHWHLEYMDGPDNKDYAREHSPDFPLKGGKIIVEGRVAELTDLEADNSGPLGEVTDLVFKVFRPLVERQKLVILEWKSGAGGIETVMLIGRSTHCEYRGAPIKISCQLTCPIPLPKDYQSPAPE